MLSRALCPTLERGWRRFGRTYFRPVCVDCEECRSLRVDVESFRPSRSMQRTLKANRDLDIELRPASANDELLDLYRRYHADMAVRRGWANPPVELDQYERTFAAEVTDFAHELVFRLEGRVVCVSIVDLLPSALSAVYCFYDPQLRPRALGVLAVLTEIEIARERECSHLYLGFRIDGNPSMRYKARYAPHQILDGRPSLRELPCWNESRP